MENVWCLHVFVAERYLHSCDIIWMSNFCEKLEDIKWYCNYLSAFLQQIYVNKTRFQCVLMEILHLMPDNRDSSDYELKVMWILVKD